MRIPDEKPLNRRGQENRILGADGKPLMVIVEGRDIDAMVDAGLGAIGGLGRVIGNTNQRDPFPSITAPETLRAVARHCRVAGVREVVVHEDHKHELDPYYALHELPGADVQISHAPDASHYVLVQHDKWRGDLDPSALLQCPEVRPPASRLLSEWQKTEGPCIRVARQLQEAPVIINMPVLKRHFAGQITSALKNHFGSVYGAHRWIAHGFLEKDRDYYDRKLAEFASAVRPELTITDVRSLQAVSGPFRGTDTQIVEGVNRLIVTADMIAADAVALELMKRYDHTFTAMNEAIVRSQHRHAEELGLGTSDLSGFEIIEMKVG
jgi:uncharacterized protein (DUF362 family)